MSCKGFVAKDGNAVMFLCSRGRETFDCDVCGKPATGECEFPFAGAKIGESCSKKLCAGCINEVKVSELPEKFQVLLRGKDSINVCPTHKRAVNDWGGG